MRDTGILGSVSLVRPLRSACRRGVGEVVCNRTCWSSQRCCLFGSGDVSFKQVPTGSRRHGRHDNHVLVMRGAALIQDSHAQGCCQYLGVMVTA